jgi:hypothetical protein
MVKNADTKAPAEGNRFRTTAVPDIAELRCDSTLSNAELRALIGARDVHEHDDVKLARDRAGKAIRSAVAYGHLVRLANGRFAVSGLGLWLRSRWPGLFLDFPVCPSRQSPVSGSIAAVVPTPTFLGTAEVLPMALNECHSRIVADARRITTLEARVRDLETQLSSCQPDVELGRRYRKAQQRKARQRRK